MAMWLRSVAEKMHHHRKKPQGSYTHRGYATAALWILAAFVLLACPFKAAAQAPGLVVAYGFNEGSGTTVTDSSGSNNAGTITGATWAQGRFGNALSFNGISDIVRIPASSSLNVSSAMTLEAWIKPTTAQSGWRTIMQREVDAYFLNASNSNGPLLPSGGGTFNGTGAYVSGTTANPVNAWTHVALTYDGAMLRLYVNGALAASQAQTGSIQTTSNPLWIGGNSPYGEYFQGIIDEVRVYNRALSQAEIQTDINTPVGPVPTKLIIIQPANGSTIVGATVAVTYTTSGDLTGVDHVHFRLDSGPEIMDVDFDGTYQFNNVSLGSHLLQGWLVRADHSKIDGTDASVAFNTTSGGTDTTPPSVNITAPGSGSTVSATTSITADASDNIGVVGVQFFVNGSPLGTEDTTTPYSVNWDTTTVVNGNYALTARARDAAGNQTTSAPVSVTVSNGTSPGPALVGQWTAPSNWPLVAVHANLLPTGDVLAWDGADQSGAAFIWRPTTNTFTSRNPPDNIFCAGHCLLPDGRLLVLGGHLANFVGIPDANIFNPSTSTWTQIPSMGFGRWYPTAITLPDGRVLVVAGDDGCHGCVAAIPEIYNPATNSWVQLNGAANSIPQYPHLFVLSDGRILATGTFEQPIATQILDVNTQTWSIVDPVVLDGHSSVMYAPDKFMKSGTSANSDAPYWPAENSTYVLDMTQAQPTWRETAPMAYPRSYHTLTILPDGNVLATGGNVTTDPHDQTQPVYPAEMWSPVTETWTTMATMSVPRFYHSTAVLLPDGRVLVAGGGRFGGGQEDDKLNAQIYSPPYLFKGSRPAISSAPNLVSYNSNFTVDTTSAATIAKAVMIPLGSVTHHFNANQRYVSLPFQVVGNGLGVQAPANANLAQPGYYMLFIVDTNGVPSVASILRLQ
jgi:Concanavalin A-like lectin/glucanases superfamily/Galactose oxidase-like, Early set domain/Bacterial Ig domain